MRRSLSMLVLVAYLFTFGCGTTNSARSTRGTDVREAAGDTVAVAENAPETAAPPDRWQKWSGDGPSRPEKPNDASADSIAFFEAVRSERHSEALALLWARTNARETRGEHAGIAAMVAGAGLAIIALDQISALNDLDASPFFEVDDGEYRTWHIVLGAGVAAAALGIWAAF